MFVISFLSTSIEFMLFPKAVKIGKAYLSRYSIQKPLQCNSFSMKNNRKA